MKQVVRAAVCVCVLGGLLAAPAVAKRIKGEVGDYLSGVDSNGNRYSPNGNDVTLKSVKYVNSGIIISRAKGMVTNDAGRRIVLRNNGNKVYDPETYSYTPATRDRYVFSRHSGKLNSKLHYLAVLNPNKVEVRYEQPDY